ncbi:MAG: imidazole glycerol phosphate synthase subunit HisF [Candidatus Peregrinibacteria bacterium]
MQVIPAIDVLNGKVVRLTQGDFERVNLYGDDPLGIAREYKRMGASRVHLVNLSAAKSGERDDRFLALVRAISGEMEVQAGGGIRTLQDIQRFLDAGASAVVIGTMLFKEPDTARSAVTLFGIERIIGALDTDDNDVKIMGWKKRSGYDLSTAIRLAEDIGIRRILVTDIACDGMESGPNVRLYADLKRRFPSVRLIASGGVRNAADVRALEKIKCESAVVGKTLLQNSVSLSSLISACSEQNYSAIDSRRDELAIRVIPCLDVTEGRVVKGTSFGNLRDAGDPVSLAKRYCEEGADELVFLDITATSDGRETVVELASRVADAVNIPFTIGGGVRSVFDARRLLEAGADKVAVNSASVRNPLLLNEIAEQLGRANTVCAIDARKKGDGWTVLVRGGRDDTEIDALLWAEEAVKRGAGELLVTSYDRDGTGEGFDTTLLSRIKERVSVPVIASGGAGSLDTFVSAVRAGRADAVLAASVFHFGTITIRDVKTAFQNASFPVRL